MTLQAAIDFVCTAPYLITGLLSCRARFVAILLHTAHVQWIQPWNCYKCPAARVLGGTIGEGCLSLQEYLNQRKRAARPPYSENTFSIGKLFGLSAARYARSTRSWLSYVPAMWHWTDRCKTLRTRSARQRDLPVAPKGITRRGKARTNSTEVLDCILMVGFNGDREVEQISGNFPDSKVKTSAFLVSCAAAREPGRETLGPHERLLTRAPHSVLRISQSNFTFHILESHYYSRRGVWTAMADLTGSFRGVCKISGSVSWMRFRNKQSRKLRSV